MTAGLCVDAYWEQTPFELAAGVTPADCSYPPNNLMRYGADPTGASKSNSALRAALAAIEKNDGGELYVPAGTYWFTRELEQNQPPETSMFGQLAGFVAGDNTIIRGDGASVTKFKVEFPNKSATLDNTKDWMFLVHGDDFHIEGITFTSDILDEEFSFRSAWGTNKIPGYIQYASRKGSVYGRRVTVKRCRFKNTIGFAYGTSIINQCQIIDCDFRYTNGVNVSGNDVRCNHNTWYYSECFESAGRGDSGITEGGAAGIEFIGNICREINGVSLGGNISTNPGQKTRGYICADNIIINQSHHALSGVAIANNALDVVVSNNVVHGKFNQCLIITEGGVQNCPPYDVHIIGGRYTSTSPGNTFGVRIDTNGGDVHIHGPYIEGQSGAGSLGIASGSKTKIYLHSGTTIKGSYMAAFTSGQSGTIHVSPGVVFIGARTSVYDLYSNISSSKSDAINYNTSIVSTKSADVANNQYVEVFRKYGGNQTLPEYCYFYRNMSGRFGWGDPDTNGPADVYLERKCADVLGLDKTDCFVTGVGTSKYRPDAIAVGAGAQWFDVTINKPIWSNGQTWVDATGNIV